MLFGSKQMGAQRWLDLGFFNLQPSEFAKATLALVLAKLLGDSRRQVLSNSELFIAVVLTAIPLLLIVRQPDLGTAVTLLPILLVVDVRRGAAGEVSRRRWPWSARWPRRWRGSLR